MEEGDILEISNGETNGDGSCSMDMENSEDIMTTEINGLDLVNLRFLFKLDLDRLGWDLGVIWN